MTAPIRHRVGIIGANWSLKVHGSAWRLLPGVEVTAVCTAHRETAEAAAQQFGIPRAYWRIEDLIADPDLTIIDVGTKPALRYDMVMAALAGGKHVYNCLPFATSLERARAQLDAQHKAQRVGVVDAQFRWSPAAMDMKRLIDEGVLGKPLGFSVQLILPLVNDGANRVHPISVWPEGGVSPYRWLGEADSGASAWRNFGAHSVLLLTHLLGPVERALGGTQCGVPEWKLPDGSQIHSETPDHAVALLRLCNGAMGTVQTGWSQPGAQFLRVEVWGDKSRLLLVDPSFGNGPTAQLFRLDARPDSTEFIARAPEPVAVPDELYAVPGTPFNRDNAPPVMIPLTHLFNNMLRAIETGTDGSPSFAEAVHAQEVVEAVLASEKLDWPAISSTF